MRPRAGARRRARGVAFVLALSLHACESRPEASSPRPSGVVDLGGTPVDPFARATERGAEAIVLVFVGTDCPLSNRYAPVLGELAARWRDDPVEAWLVYPDPKDDAAAIEAHRSAYDLRWPALRDPEHTLALRAAATVTPEAAVFGLGADEPTYRGRIDDRVVTFGTMRAEASRHDLRDAVEAVLRHEAPASPTQPAIGCYISDLR